MEQTEKHLFATQIPGTRKHCIGHDVHSKVLMWRDLGSTLCLTDELCLKCQACVMYSFYSQCTSMQDQEDICKMLV